jgi:hypothetical protein
VVIHSSDVGPGLQADFRNRRFPETLFRKNIARCRQQLSTGPCRIFSRDLHHGLSLTTLNTHLKYTFEIVNGYFEEAKASFCQFKLFFIYILN